MKFIQEGEKKKASSSIYIMAKVIEGFEISGFVDHDYEVLSKLTPEGMIEWFKYRFRKILFNPARSMIEHNAILETDNSSIYTMILLSIIVGIDTFGGFICGIQGDNNKDSFGIFVQKYLDQQHKYLEKPFGGYGDLASLLRELFRNGLAHNYTIKKVGFCHEGDYFREENGLYYINIYRLLEDLEIGFNQYISDLTINGTLKDKFIKRFEWVFIHRN